MDLGIRSKHKIRLGLIISSLVFGFLFTAFAGIVLYAYTLTSVFSGGELMCYGFFSDGSPCSYVDIVVRGAGFLLGGFRDAESWIIPLVSAGIFYIAVDNISRLKARAV
ncbi:hypothetical protein C4552_04890 [Candidatus Parcubacteria bacterium]|nr:MAG: hypothetical protein C4552_04890 [Candidatus Parcubacteria bacterium]